MPSTTVDPRSAALHLIAHLDATAVELLATDPVEAVEELVGIPITFRPGSAGGSACGVDGSYDPGPPARIFIADDIMPTRRAFTVLHEYGHHLVEDDDQLNELGLTDGDRRIEEVADAVAAALLLNADLVEHYLTSTPPTAAQVADLFDATEASRSACCVAAAQRLGRHGCVMLVTDDGVARFTAHQIGTPWRVARSTAQGTASIVHHAGGSGATVTRRSPVTFANGNDSSPLFAQAHRCPDGWIFAVFVDDTIDPWAPKEGLHLPAEVDFGTEYECPHCDMTFTTGAAPCRKCGTPVHEQCGRCACRVEVKSRRCEGPCGLMKPEHQFDVGSVYCVDCV